MHRNRASRSSCLAIATIALLLATVTPAAAALVCNPNGSSCTGTYHELVDWERHFRTGTVMIRPTSAVRTEIDSSGYCPLHLGTYVLVQDASGASERMLDRLLVAKVLGETVRMEWQTGTSGSCELFAIVFYGE